MGRKICNICNKSVKNVEKHICDSLSPFILNKRLIDLEEAEGLKLTGHKFGGIICENLISLQFGDKFVVLRSDQGYNNIELSVEKDVEEIGMKESKDLGIISQEEYELYKKRVNSEKKEIIEKRQKAEYLRLKKIYEGE